MSLRQKLLAGFALVAAITAAVGTAGFLALQRTSRNVDELGLNRLPSLRSLLSVSVAQNIIDSAENALLSRAMTKEERAAAWARFDLGQLQAEQALKVYEPLPQTAEEAALWARFVPAWKAWLADHERYLELARAFERTGSDQDYARMSAQALTANYRTFGEAEALLQQLVRLNEGLGAQATAEALATAASARRFLAVGVVAATLAAALVGLWLASTINRALSRVITSLRAGAGQVASASGQVSASSQQLANGATQQAASLQEISSSLVEIGSMTRQNAVSARAASGSAQEASAAASQGEGAVQALAEAVARIRESAGQTAKIVKTIDEIAFQTNLLALNAAVEAARAGDAGRGFAVVAEEVRGLALRAAEAARTTGELLEASGRHAEGGVVAAGAVSTALKGILGSVGTVTGYAQQVASASDEQARGVDQITTAVSQLDTLTQGTAASAEESAAASEELSGQAVEVEHAVESLVALVSGAEGTARPPPRAP